MSDRADGAVVLSGRVGVEVPAGSRGGRRDEEAAEGIEAVVDARGTGVMGSRGVDECRRRAAWKAI